LPDDDRDRRLRVYLDRQRAAEAQGEGQVDTRRFPTLERAPQVQILPVERPVCPGHSGVEVRLAHLEARDAEITGEQRKQAAEIDRLRMLPWRVVGAAVGGGGGVAGIIEILRALFA
jgi:hypothetical protein